MPLQDNRVRDMGSKIFGESVCLGSIRQESIRLRVARCRWVGETLRGQMQCLIPDNATLVNSEIVSRCT
jgi:hypothetical protein